MPRNKIDDLRNHLFETIEMLKDKEIDVNTAKAISEVAQVIVNTAKVEIQFINRQNSSEEIGFIKLDNKK
jgi:hypothetical protein